jgi:hypothetical protein
VLSSLSGLQRDWLSRRLDRPDVVAKTPSPTGAYLKGQPEIKANEIGPIGDSEGGLIAPMTAARDASVAFIVLMAGPGLRGDQILGGSSSIARAGYGCKPRSDREATGIAASARGRRRRRT